MDVPTQKRNELVASLHILITFLPRLYRSMPFFISISFPRIVVRRLAKGRTCRVGMQASDSLPIAHCPHTDPAATNIVIVRATLFFLVHGNEQQTGQESTTQQGLTNHPNGLWWSGDDKTRPDKFRQDDAAHQQSTVAASEFVFASSLTNERTNDERTLSFAFFGCSPPLCDGSNVFSFAPSFPLQLATWRRPLVCFMLTFLLLLWGWRSEKWVGRCCASRR